MFLFGFPSFDSIILTVFYFNLGTAVDIPKGYMTFQDESASSPETKTRNLRHRDMTSPINADDHHLDSSTGKGGVFKKDYPGDI